MPDLPKIHVITNKILDTNLHDYAELFSACDELYNALLLVCDIDIHENHNINNLSLENGEAIGLNWAALCIKDLMRTKKFMDAVYEATRNKINSNPGKKIHILYAGTGPFATLVLPLTAKFASTDIQFSFLEINDASYECLQKMIKFLHLEKYIHRIEKADATKWEIPTGDNIDIFICEAMQQGLKKEPQVAICQNIVPQLSEETIIIPTQVVLKAVLINPEKRMQEKLELDDELKSIHELGTVLTLSRESILNDDVFAEKVFDIPEETAHNYPELSILTEISIYNDHKLLIDESALTMPLK
ncbi:MAG TPA: hypothetical protein VJT83_05350, partial [Chitinophagaceae bacterium]|nr:hypothetical protein [Chitinophagaceae bacterium]